MDDGDLPKRKPREVKEDCNSALTSLKQKMKNSYDKFSSYGGYTLGNGKKLPSFQDYLDKVTAQPNIEHSFEIRFNNTDNSFYSTSIQTGTSTNASIEEAINSVAHIHNHPKNLPPSPQDIATTIDAAKTSKVYVAHYIRMPDGTTYAFKVTDRDKINQFSQKYGNQMAIDKKTNRFTPQSKFDKTWREANDKFEKLGEITAWEYTIAYLFDKYDMGLVLLKKDANSNTFKVQYVRKGSDNRYELIECK